MLQFCSRGTICRRKVKNGIQCEMCDNWHHFGKCSNIEEFNIPENWFCDTCKQTSKDDDVNGTTVNNITHGDVLAEVIQQLKQEIDSLTENIKILQEDIRQLHENLNLRAVNCNEHSSTKIRPAVKEINRIINQSSIEIVNEKLTKVNHGYVKTQSHIVNQGNVNSINNSKIINKSLQEKTKPLERVLLLGDSHGKGLANEILSRTDGFGVTGLIKPGARINEVLGPVIQKSQIVEESDYLIIMGGSNDLARNQGGIAMQCLDENLSNLGHKQTIVTSIPYRFDLIDTSCVNLAIKEINIGYEKVCKKYKNVLFIDITFVERSNHTKQGMHMNKTGKIMVASKLCDAIIYFKNLKQVKKLTFLDKWVEKGNKTKSSIVDDSLKMPKVKKLTFLDKWIAKGNKDNCTGNFLD